MSERICGPPGGVETELEFPKKLPVHCAETVNGGEIESSVILLFQMKMKKPRTVSLLPTVRGFIIAYSMTESPVLSGAGKLMNGCAKSDLSHSITVSPEQRRFLHIHARAAWGIAKAFQQTIHWMVCFHCLLTSLGERFAFLLSQGGFAPLHPLPPLKRRAKLLCFFLIWACAMLGVFARRTAAHLFKIFRKMRQTMKSR